MKNKKIKVKTLRKRSELEALNIGDRVNLNIGDHTFVAFYIGNAVIGEGKLPGVDETGRYYSFIFRDQSGKRIGSFRDRLHRIVVYGGELYTDKPLKLVTHPVDYEVLDSILKGEGL